MRETEIDYHPDPLGRLGYGIRAPRSPRDPFGRLRLTLVEAARGGRAF